MAGAWWWGLYFLDPLCGLIGAGAIYLDIPRAVQLAVESGEKLGDLLEVRGGIKAGDRLVLRPPETLRDGARVFRIVAIRERERRFLDIDAEQRTD